MAGVVLAPAATLFLSPKSSSSTPYFPTQILFSCSLSPFHFCTVSSSLFATPEAQVSTQTGEWEMQDLEKPEKEVDKLSEMKQKIEDVGISCDFTSPGQYIILTCPKCKGGRSLERSLSFYINQNKEFAMWRCFRMECGWADRVFAERLDLSRKTEESLGLEPLSHERQRQLVAEINDGDNPRN